MLLQLQQPWGACCTLNTQEVQWPRVTVQIQNSKTFTLNSTYKKIPTLGPKLENYINKPMQKTKEDVYVPKKPALKLAPVLSYYFLFRFRFTPTLPSFLSLLTLYFKKYTYLILHYDECYLFFKSYHPSFPWLNTGENKTITTSSYHSIKYHKQTPVFCINVTDENMEVQKSALINSAHIFSFV